MWHQNDYLAQNRTSILVLRLEEKKCLTVEVRVQLYPFFCSKTTDYFTKHETTNVILFGEYTLPQGWNTNHTWREEVTVINWVMVRQTHRTSVTTHFLCLNKKKKKKNCCILHMQASCLLRQTFFSYQPNNTAHMKAWGKKVNNSHFYRWYPPWRTTCCS